jgi:hypothetical protein
MEFEMPVGKPTKAEFLDRMQDTLAGYGFERKRHRFIRNLDGYVRVQVIEFLSGGGSHGHFRLAPYLLLQPNSGRGTLGVSLEKPTGALLSHFGSMLKVERSNYVSYYDNWFGDPDWFELFECVLKTVLEFLDPLMKDESRLNEFIKSAFGASHVVNVGAKQQKPS